jgi:hypothetical protein
MEGVGKPEDRLNRPSGSGEDPDRYSQPGLNNNAPFNIDRDTSKLLGLLAILFGVAIRRLGFPGDFSGGTFDLRSCTACHFARYFLNFPGCFLGAAFNLILVHNVLLSVSCRFSTAIKSNAKPIPVLVQQRLPWTEFRSAAWAV